jgi:hypothetical protein
MPRQKRANSNSATAPIAGKKPRNPPAKPPLKHPIVRPSRSRRLLARIAEDEPIKEKDPLEYIYTAGVGRRVVG